LSSHHPLTSAIRFNSCVMVSRRPSSKALMVACSFNLIFVAHQNNSQVGLGRYRSTYIWNRISQSQPRNYKQFVHLKYLESTRYRSFCRQFVLNLIWGQRLNTIIALEHFLERVESYCMLPARRRRSDVVAAFADTSGVTNDDVK